MTTPQKFKTFYARLIKERDDFESVREEKYKKSADVSDLLDELIDKFTTDIYESLNQLNEKMITLEKVIEIISQISDSEYLTNSIEYGKGCVDLFEQFNKDKKTAEKTGKKTNISTECGIILPISRFKNMIKSKSAPTKLKATIPVFFAGFYESLIVTLLLDSFASLENKTLKKENIIDVIKTNDNFSFFINYV